MTKAQPASKPAEIPRVALHEQVAERLRAMLVEGQIKPGAKLNERELCELLSVSRTPLREAIKLLAAEGLVELLPNRGAVAACMDESDIISTFEVLASLEGLSGELAAQRVTDEELDEIRALHYEMMACFARKNLAGYYELNARIHAAINAAAKNPVLSQVYRSVNARAHPMRFHTNQDPNKWQHAAREHGEMLEALAAHDAPRLRALLMAHLHSKRDTVLDQMRRGALGAATK
ncbi:GntR family transcriptional regulator [Acidovorax sp. MR-S7]|jgi:DNA-binding GntR family transcriptional regulator|uniref:GntR family transcriptional regulator n=1 Tax=unclassified Acidovorax TaxID=2684926 RepID=UPI000371FE97|nr:GntR family transcriptional regulator [Acidovorax sp. MR-S7]GAD24436.1 transcriptional regulator [Acidovorax sp. MR-S7]